MTRLPSNSKRSPVCCCLVAKSCLTLCNPWAATCQAPLSFTISQRLLSLMSIEPVMLSNHLISSVVPFSLSSVFPRVLKAPSIRAFSNESSHYIRWPKYWSFSISPSSEYSGLISFRVDCLWSPCSPRDSQESSLAPRFEKITSSALSLLYGPNLMSVHDHWKNHSFDYTDLCQRFGVSAF